MFRLNMILLALLIAAIAAIGILVGRSFGGGGGSGIVSDKKETDIRATVREVLPAAEFISLHYRYTSVINNVDSKMMFGIYIPGTEKKLLAVIDGTIKLGVDCSQLKIDSLRTDTIFIKFPPIKILAHEMHPETAQVYDQKNGLFNKYRATDHFALEAQQKSEVELNVRSNKELIVQARNATEYAFKSFLSMIPALDTVPIAFKWN